MLTLEDHKLYDGRVCALTSYQFKEITCWLEIIVIIPFKQNELFLKSKVICFQDLQGGTGGS